ncbi:MAG: RDD family protein [Nitrospinota bacterium]|nr:RDD family protein [Nitrospinota bacterium]
MTIDPEFSFENRDGGGDVGMELCQVTGKLVAKEEIVELHGYRVCVEGKQELLRRMRAGVAMPGELETAAFPKRLLALILDMVILWLVFQVASLYFGFYMEFAPIQIHIESDRFWMNMPDPFLGKFRSACYVAAMVYFAVFHGRYGQSIGKIAMGIKLIGLDGRPAGYRQAIIRAIILIGPISVVPLLRNYAWRIINDKNSSGSWNWMYIELSYVLIMVLLLVSALLAITDRAEQKSLHDRLASTRVVVKQ